MNPDCDSRALTEPTEEAAETEPPSWLAIDVQIDDDGWRALGQIEPTILRAAGALALHVGRAQPVPAAAFASIALAGDADVAALNSQFRGKTMPTNVLSFPAPQDTPGKKPAQRAPNPIRYLGDVILARETILLEARASETPPLDHVAHLVVHGLLHLLGHDHATDAEADVMETAEIEILAALDIENPYPDRRAARPLLEGQTQP